MSNKIALIYTNGKYNLTINDSIVEIDSDIESSFLKFKNMIKNNVSSSEKSWNYIEENIKSFNNENVEIDSRFKTIAIGTLKYFYNTGKVFYIGENKMVPLIGGYEFLKFIVKTKALKDISHLNSFLELCELVIENKATYRTGEEHIAIYSPALNYGSVEFNFSTNKVNKGVSVEDGDFEAFKEYALSIIKR